MVAAWIGLLAAAIVLSTGRASSAAPHGSTAPTATTLPAERSNSQFAGSTLRMTPIAYGEGPIDPIGIEGTGSSSTAQQVLHVKVPACDASCRATARVDALRQSVRGAGPSSRPIPSAAALAFAALLGVRVVGSAAPRRRQAPAI
jgi:hypothetical protein